MTGQRLDGAAEARALNRGLADRVRQLARPPGLAVVLVGEDAASRVYVRRKADVAERLGFHHRQIDLPAQCTLDRLLRVLKELNEDGQIDGILVQMPLPPHLDTHRVLDTIDPRKDADGLHAVNLGLLVQGRATLAPCTPAGVMHLVRRAWPELSGARAVVIGRSTIVGRPMALLLEQANCTVTIAHSRTRDLPSLAREADILVAAVGRPELVRGDWIRPGAMVVDVGINRVGDRLVGDVCAEEVQEVAGVWTPVPGGVGPMTIAMLMRNAWRASLEAQGGGVPLAPG